MFCYPKTALERAMKLQEVILRAMAKRITWWQAAEIIGISDRQMRRWRYRYEQFGYDGHCSTSGRGGRRQNGCRRRCWNKCWGYTASSTSISTCAIFTRSCGKRITSNSVTAG